MLVSHGQRTVNEANKASRKIKEIRNYSGVRGLYDSIVLKDLVKKMRVYNRAVDSRKYNQR